MKICIIQFSGIEMWGSDVLSAIYHNENGPYVVNISGCDYYSQSYSWQTNVRKYGPYRVTQIGMEYYYSSAKK